MPCFPKVNANHLALFALHLRSNPRQAEWRRRDICDVQCLAGEVRVHAAFQDPQERVHVRSFRKAQVSLGSVQDADTARHLTSLRASQSTKPALRPMIAIESKPGSRCLREAVLESVIRAEDSQDPCITVLCARCLESQSAHVCIFSIGIRSGGCKRPQCWSTSAEVGRVVRCLHNMFMHTVATLSDCLQKHAKLEG